jgi:hypothetical protein
VLDHFPSFSLHIAHEFSLCLKYVKQFSTPFSQYFFVECLLFQEVLSKLPCQPTWTIIMLKLIYSWHVWYRLLDPSPLFRLFLSKSENIYYTNKYNLIIGSLENNWEVNGSRTVYLESFNPTKIIKSIIIPSVIMDYFFLL